MRRTQEVTVGLYEGGSPVNAFARAVTGSSVVKCTLLCSSARVYPRGAATHLPRYCSLRRVAHGSRDWRLVVPGRAARAG